MNKFCLQFGCDSKLVLEYSWDPPMTQPKSEKVPEKPPQDVSQEPSPDNTEEEIKKIETDSDLAYTLKRLISIAKLHYRKNVIKCPCGHVCHANKQTSVKPKPIVNKAPKVPENKSQQDASEVSRFEEGIRRSMIMRDILAGHHHQRIER